MDNNLAVIKRCEIPGRMLVGRQKKVLSDPTYSYSKSSSLHSGFTLVEIMIGLALLGMILLMMFSGLRTSAMSWEASDRLAVTNDQGRLVISFIRRQLKQLVPIIVREEGKVEVIFEGTSESLSMVTRLPSYRGTSGLYLVTFSLQESVNDLNSLFYTYQPLHPDVVFSDEEVSLGEQVLIEGISGVAFSYYGRAEIDDEFGAWTDRWEPLDRLPELIGLSIYADDPARDWPELVVQLPAQVEVGQAQLTLLDPLNVD